MERQCIFFKSSKRAIILLMLILFLTAVFGGCQVREEEGKNNDGHIPGWQLNADDPITLDWYINYSWFTDTWGDSLTAKTITEETGIEINFITPTGSEWEKLNAMITSQSLPDLVTLGHWEPQIDQMILEGQVYALNELADEYDPYFWTVAHPQRTAWYTQDDGNIYAYPNSSYAPSDYDSHKNIGSNQAFLVRKDIYEGIGSPDMTTPESFKQAVRDAAAYCPDVDGQPLIPIGLYDFDKDGSYSLESMLMNLLAIPHERNGAKVDRHTDPDYITWLKTFNELWREGYFPDDIFLDKRVQTAEKVAQGRYFCMIYQHTDIADQQKYLYAQKPGSEYIAVDGPKNSAGDDHILPGVGINGWTVTLISKNCSNPDRAIQLMSYMMSEHGQKILYCGVEGITYDMIDGKPVIRPDVLKLLNTDRVEYNRLYAADNTYWMLQDLVMQLDWQPEPLPPLSQPLEWSYPYTVYAAQYEITFPMGTETAYANQNIREEWGRTLPKLLTAESEEEFDSIFDDYLIKRDALGFLKVEQKSHDLIQEAEDKLRNFKSRN